MLSVSASVRLTNACSGCGAAVVTDRMKRRERTIKLSLCIAAQARFGWEVENSEAAAEVWLL